MAFSSDDMHLLTCSRDRQWCLFKRESMESLSFSLVKKEKDAHSRIIWGISWSHDDQLFATCSREKQKAVKVWHAPTSEGQDVGTLHSELPANAASASTAISFFPNLVNEAYHLMVGLESGALMVWRLTDDTKSWTKLIDVASYYAHTLSVKRIRFNLRFSEPE